MARKENASYENERARESLKLKNCFTTDNPPTAKQVGAVPFIDVRGADYDMDIIFKNGLTYTFYLTDGDTLSTPYKYGASTSTNALILQFKVSTNYGFQVAFLSGDKIPLMRSNSGGTISDWTTGFLPLTGGTLSGKLSIDAALDILNSAVESIGRLAINSAGAYCFINVHPDGNTQITLEKASYTLAQVLRLTVAGTTYALHGTHNKPSGSYTGNGSATSRTINTGGIGDLILIRGTSLAIVASHGAIIQGSSGSVISLDNSEIKFSGGVLTIATTSRYFNLDGRTFLYTVL